MTEQISHYIVDVYPEKISDIVELDFWETVTEEDDGTYRLLFNSTTSNIFNQTVEITGIFEIRPSDLCIVYTKSENSISTFKSIKEEFELRNMRFSLYSPTYTELCTLYRKADKFSAYMIGNDTGYVDVTEKVEMGENIPTEITKMKFNINNQEIMAKYEDRNLSIEIDESLDSVHKNKCREELMKMIEQSFNF